MGCARDWDPVRLRVLWWKAVDHTPGDALRTRSGRRYLILKVHRRRHPYPPEEVGRISSLSCLVLPEGEKVQGEIQRGEHADPCELEDEE